MNPIFELEKLVRAGSEVIAVETFEEDRFLRYIYDTFKGQMDILTSTPTMGLRYVSKPREFYIPPEAGDGKLAVTIPDIMRKLRDDVMDRLTKGGTGGSRPTLVILRSYDISPMSGGISARWIKDVIPIIYSTANRSRYTTILVNTVIDIHPILEKDVSVFTMPLMTRDDINSRISEHIKVYDNALKEEPEAKAWIDGADMSREEAWKVNYSDIEMYDITNALTGLTESEVDAAIKYAFKSKEQLDPIILGNRKCDILKRTDLLELYQDHLAPTMNVVGGWDLFKEWVSVRSKAFSSETARMYGLPPPKGTLLLGPPGTGKSLSAKSVGRTYGLPIIRLDIGRIMDRLVGSSERNMRSVIQILESIGKCVVWFRKLPVDPLVSNY